ncbi:MFS transporter [Nocardioides houyundeii]|uniref:MFS transporter n=1 Tax=Nocardioides houyundeii TaxID=2045452 RepID=UPI000C76FDE5|nr:MFS transporter [Nocardioides houyundeii]
MTSRLESEQVRRIQRRTVRVLVVGQALGAVGITIGIATASLLARDISGSEGQAGLAQTAQVLGAAFASYLLARLMAARGRRLGQVTGLLIGASGALLAVVAGVLDSMVLLLVGAALLGATTAANSGARYAATDLAPDATRAKALGTVVWATTVGAVLGPNLTGPAAALSRRLDIPELTGPFALGALSMLLAAAFLGVFLRPDPLLIARDLAAEQPRVPAGRSWQRAWQVVRATPALAAAIGALASAHAVMVAVMIMTPLHMEHGGAAMDLVGFVISVHVLGMYAFSPLAGIAADRAGRPAVLMAGAVVLLLALLLCGRAPEGHSAGITVGLFLLGLGWSLVTVAASTMIAELTPLDARTDVQGAADMAMGLMAAAAGALAGVVVGAWGYPALNVFAAFLTAGVVGAGLVARRVTGPPAVPTGAPLDPSATRGRGKS